MKWIGPERQIGYRADRFSREETGLARRDAQLLHATAGGDADAFAELMVRHYRSVRGFVLADVGDPTEADDVTQETFIEVYRCAHTFNGAANVVAWLLGIARNRSRMAIRRRTRYETCLAALTTRARLDWAYVRQSFAARADAHDMRLDIRRAVYALPQIYRLPVILRYQMGLGCAEIAAVVGVARATAAVRLHRARGLLRDALRHLDPKRETADAGL